MYRAGIEGIIGLTREGDTLILDPCLPADWPGVSVSVRLASGLVQIEAANPFATGRGISETWVDGLAARHAGGPFRLDLRAGPRTVRLTLGAEKG